VPASPAPPTALLQLPSASERSSTAPSELHLKLPGIDTAAAVASTPNRVQLESAGASPREGVPAARAADGATASPRPMGDSHVSMTGTAATSNTLDKPVVRTGAREHDQQPNSARARGVHSGPQHRVAVTFDNFGSWDDVEALFDDPQPQSAQHQALEPSVERKKHDVDHVGFNSGHELAMKPKHHKSAPSATSLVASAQPDHAVKSELLLQLAVEQSLLVSVRAQCTIVRQVSLHLFLRQLRLAEHFAALRRYLFMNAGDALDIFAASLFTGLRAVRGWYLCFDCTLIAVLTVHCILR